MNTGYSGVCGDCLFYAENSLWCNLIDKMKLLGRGLIWMFLRECLSLRGCTELEKVPEKACGICM